jgi:hypothetical protein
MGILSSEKCTFRHFFSKKFTEDIYMKTEFWSNMEKARIEAQKDRKVITIECGLTSNAFSRGLERKSDPGVSTAYKCAKAVEKTIEELLDGETGIEYIRQIVQKKGWQFSPPERVAGIVEAAGMLSDEQLDYVMGLIRTMLDKKEASGMPPEAKSARKTG